MNQNQAAIDELQWKKFPVLSDGFVTLVDVMGDDSSITQAARVSYGRDKRDGEEQKGDRKTLRYLFRQGHTTPFEMAEIKLLVRVPMDCWRQWIRQRTASVNEYSTRYTTAIDSRDTTKPTEWREQSDSNKQGSSGVFEADNPGYWDGNTFTRREQELHKLAQEVYAERIKAKVANEQARKDLPLSTYTEAYWKIDLHNMFNFLWRRMDSHAQKEIRDYANIIGNEIVAKLFPECWQAFLDYKMNAMTLSALEVEALRTGSVKHLEGRELQDFHSKFVKLNFIPKD